MSLDTYANLQAAIVARATRTYDTGLVTDSIALAEARINADLGLEATASVTNLVMTPGSNTTTHDPTALVIRAMRYGQADGGAIIEACAPERWADVKTSERGQPAYYLPRSSTIEWNCPAQSAFAVEVETFGRLNISSTSTNWLLTNIPQIYLAGTMVELMVGPERNDAEFQKWETMYARALRDARTLLTRIMGRSEVRLKFDTPDCGTDYDVESDE
jgi:hypothetical protein